MNPVDHNVEYNKLRQELSKVHATIDTLVERQEQLQSQLHHMERLREGIENNALSDCKCGTIPDIIDGLMIAPYIQCPKCQRRTGKYAYVSAAIQAWNRGERS